MNVFIRLLSLIFLYFFAFLPGRIRSYIGTGLGVMASQLMPNLRKVVEQNLKITGLCNAKDCDLLVKKTFIQLGLGISELGPLWLRAPQKSLSVIQEIQGLDEVEAAVNMGKGVVLFTGHYGSWETLIQFLPTRWPMTVLYRKIGNDSLDFLIKKFRSRTGATMVEKHSAIKPLLKALKRGEVIGVLTDQNVDVHEGLFSPFFARPASTSPLLARLAGARHSPIFGVYATRLGSKEGVTIKFMALQYDSDLIDEQFILDQQNKQLEAVVRSRPEQYWWFHKRYKAVALGWDNPYEKK